MKKEEAYLLKIRDTDILEPKNKEIIVVKDAGSDKTRIVM